MAHDPFDPYLKRWALVPDGVPIVTETSSLLPVKSAGLPAMLKIARAAEERRGGLVMSTWLGDGLAPVMAQEDCALLLARADEKELAELSRSGQDEGASRILCAVAARLHAAPAASEHLIPLPRWFASLRRAAGSQSEFFASAAETARSLLAGETDRVPLHGDLHHGNVPVSYTI
jgi:streptomycin 6-kinase